MPEAYNPKVIEHLVRPRNVGELEAPSGVGESGDATCGDEARVSKAELEAALGGALPEGKGHALTLVLDALHKAFEDHWNRHAGEMLVEAHRGRGVGGRSVVAAMSGGVDSAGTALLLKKGGLEVATAALPLQHGERGS